MLFIYIKHAWISVTLFKTIKKCKGKVGKEPKVVNELNYEYVTKDNE